MPTFNFTDIPSGAIGYGAFVTPRGPGAQFEVGFGNSGAGFSPDPSQTGVSFLGFSGVSGKLYDNDENYINSYNNDRILISGCIFDDYHTYFINNILTNTNCSRRTGTINAFFINGLPLQNVSAQVFGKTGDCCM